MRPSFYSITDSRFPRDVTIFLAGVEQLKIKLPLGRFVVSLMDIKIDVMAKFYA